MIIKTYQPHKLSVWYVTVNGQIDHNIPPQWTEGKAEGRAMINYPGHRIITTEDADYTEGVKA